MTQKAKPARLQPVSQLIPTQYMRLAYKPIELIAGWSKVFQAEDAELSLTDFDTIVVRGTSGIVAGAVLASVANKNLCVIRKKGVNCHTDRVVDGVLGARWLFVDDFISSGATLLACMQALADYATEYVGMFLYSQYSQCVLTRGLASSSFSAPTYEAIVAALADKAARLYPEHEKTACEANTAPSASSGEANEPQTTDEVHWPVDDPSPECDTIRFLEASVGRT